MTRITKAELLAQRDQAVRELQRRLSEIADRQREIAALPLRDRITYHMDEGQALHSDAIAMEVALEHLGAFIWMPVEIRDSAKEAALMAQIAA